MPLSIISTNYRRSTILFISLFVFFSAGISVIRYKKGKHYTPFYVELSTAPQTQVFSISPHGTIRELLQHDARAGLFFFPDYDSGPAEALGITKHPSLMLPDVLTVTLSESYIGIGRKVQLHREHSLQPEIRTKLPENIAVYGTQEDNSLLPNLAKRCFNWAGDVLFFAIAAVLATFLTSLTHLIMHVCTKLGDNRTGRRDERNKLTQISTAIPIAIAILFLFYHFSSTILDLIMGVTPLETVFATIFATAALTIPFLWERAFQTLSRLNLNNTHIAAIALPALFGIRILVSGSFPSYQSGDYATYARLGILISEGNWQSLNNGFYLDRVYAERALLFGAPVALLSQITFLATHIINFGIVASLSVSMFQIVSSNFGRSAGMITAIFFNLHPDILFGGHLCRHDNPSLLYLLIILFVTSNLYERIWLQKQTQRHGFRKWVIAIVATGVLLGLLEVQRSYLPFMLVTISVMLLPPQILLQTFPSQLFVRHTLKRIFLSTLALTIIAAIGVSLATSIRAYLEQKSGQFTTRSLTDSLCALETQKPGDWQSLHGWLANYPPSIPEKFRAEFARRKLLYEKFSEYEHMPSHILQKAASVVGVRSAIRMSGAQQQYELFPHVFFVPFASAKFSFGFCCMIVLLSLAIFRLLNLKRLPPKSFEIAFFLFSVIFVSIVLLLTEASEQYDLFLAIPLAINAGITLSSGFKKVTSPSTKSTLPILADTPSIKSLLLGTSCLIMLYLAYYGVGFYISRQPKITFAKANSDVSTTGPAILESQHERLALRFNSTTIPSDTTITATTRMRRSDFSDNFLRFLISLDQRHQNKIWSTEDNGNEDVEYEIKMNNKIVHQGSLTSLNTPVYTSLELPEKDNIEITLQMRSSSGLKNATTNPPILAVEYFH